MARRNSYMPPTHEYYPFHSSNPPNSNSQRQFDSSIHVATENTVFNSHSIPFHGQFHYPLPALGSGQILPYPSLYAHPCNDLHICENGTNMVSRHEENGRVSLKRKHEIAHPNQNELGFFPAWSAPSLPDRRNSFTRYTAGIAAHFPSETFVSTGEQYRRNVRSRHGDASFSLSWQSSSSNPAHQFSASANNFSSSVVRQGGQQYLPGTQAQWIHPNVSGSSTLLPNQSTAGNIPTGANINNYGPYYSISSTSHASAIGMAGPSRYNHRHISATTFKFSTPSVVDGSNSFSRNSTPITRNGDLRISNGARPLFDGDNPGARWASSQGSVMMDATRYFRNFDLFDEYRELRLDIDGMSYEELLALEERIGNVSTGLSEGHFSLCLTQTVYCSSNSNQFDQFEASCPICLEEYKDEDNIGIMNCDHTYHISCIEDWLRIKNACPICKSPALDITEQQK